MTLQETGLANRVDSADAQIASMGQSAFNWPAELEDNNLMQDVAKGDVAAFRTLVERHSPELYRACYRILGDAAEAEDALQDTFSSLWQNAPAWQPTGSGLPGWLKRVTINFCLQRLRRLKVVPADNLPDLADPSPDPEVALASKKMEQAVAQALQDLPARHRVALVLTYYEGYSNALVADILDLNIKALESLLFRARQSLRGLLESRGVLSCDREMLS